MKIEFTKDEVTNIILAAARQFDPQMNTVTLDGSYGRVGATVSYIDPVVAEKERIESDRAMAEYRAENIAKALAKETA